MQATARCQAGDGVPLEPGVGVLPILKELEPGRLMVVGTGFYLTRYGLVVTAGHVIEDLRSGANSIRNSFVVHWWKENAIVLRPVRIAHFRPEIDIGILQVDNFVEQWPESPLRNRRCEISTKVPAVGERLVTYAYPENRVLDFNGSDVVLLRGDYFEGVCLRYVAQSEHPFFRHSYIESTIELLSGSSGGPVFNSEGKVVAVNCRGWDFRGGEHEGSPLSYLVPIEKLLDLHVDISMVPSISWEFRQIPKECQNGPISIRDLVGFGHIIEK